MTLVIVLDINGGEYEEEIRFVAHGDPVEIRLGGVRIWPLDDSHDGQVNSQISSGAP